MERNISVGMIIHALVILVLFYAASWAWGYYGARFYGDGPIWQFEMFDGLFGMAVLLFIARLGRTVTIPTLLAVAFLVWGSWHIYNRPQAFIDSISQNNIGSTVGVAQATVTRVWTPDSRYGQAGYKLGRHRYIRDQDGLGVRYEYKVNGVHYVQEDAQYSRHTLSRGDHVSVWYMSDDPGVSRLPDNVEYPSEQTGP